MTDSAADLFGDPPLIKGEDKERYFRLFSAIEHHVEPKTIFDKILVRELTDKLWEQQRCKDSAAALVDGAFIDALASLLSPFMPTISFGDPAMEMARDYYSGDAKAQRAREIELRLAQYGITPEQIRAKAMQLCGGGVLMFNRMGSNCETSLRVLHKQIERRAAVNHDAPARASD